MDEEDQVIDALIRFTMLEYEGRRAMGEAPAFALREAMKKKDALVERASRAAYHTALKANYRDIREIAEANT